MYVLYVNMCMTVCVLMCMNMLMIITIASCYNCTLKGRMQFLLKRTSKCDFWLFKKKDQSSLHKRKKC